MKYALLNGEKIEPQKGIKDAICPCCGEIVIPKCGKIKIHHWAHKSKENCDPWWENETEWHRQWKDNFPKEWQEIVMHDESTGEKHVADVKTKTGIVLEFQHSPMSIEEQYSREQFYENMIWVVDAQDKFWNLKHHKDNKEIIKKFKNTEYFYFNINFDLFPLRWLNSSTPVIFDFGINTQNNTNDKLKKWLWCVLPNEIDNKRIGFYIKKQDFINQISNNKNFLENNTILEIEKEILKNIKREKEKQRAQMQKLRKQLQEQEILKKKNEFELSKKRTEEKNKKKKNDELYEQNYKTFKNNLKNKNIKPLYLKIIQKKSKELEDNQNLKIGDIYSNITKNIYNNAIAIVCGVKINYLEYSDDKRNSILNTYNENSNTVKTAKKIKKYDTSTYTELQTSNGNILDKRYEFLIIIQSETDIQPAIISLPNKKGEDITNNLYENANKYILFRIKTYNDNGYYKFALEKPNLFVTDEEIIKIIEQVKMLSGKILYEK